MASWYVCNTGICQDSGFAFKDLLFLGEGDDPECPRCRGCCNALAEELGRGELESLRREVPERIASLLPRTPTTKDMGGDIDQFLELPEDSELLDMLLVKLSPWGYGKDDVAPRARELVDRLLILTRREGFIRSLATMALGGMGETLPLDTRAAVANRLLEMSHGRDQGTPEAIRALGDMREAIPSTSLDTVVTRLEELSRDPDPKSRADAAYSLGRLVGILEESRRMAVFRLLLELAKEDEVEVVTQAARGIGSTDEALPRDVLQAAVSRLIELSQHKVYWVRAAAANGLRRLAAVVPQEYQTPIFLELMVLADSPEDSFREIAASAFGEAAEEIPEELRNRALETLIALAQDRNPLVRLRAARSLGKVEFMNPASRNVVERQLERLTSDEWEPTRLTAQDSLDRVRR